MEEKRLIERLSEGEKILCPECGKAYIEPFQTTPDKAHSFVCPECDFETHWIPIVNIE